MGLKCNNYIGICLCLRAEINWERRALETVRFTGTRSEKSTGSSEVVITHSTQQPVPSTALHCCSSCLTVCMQQPAWNSPMSQSWILLLSCTGPPEITQPWHQPTVEHSPLPWSTGLSVASDKHLHKTQDLALGDTERLLQLIHGKTNQCAASRLRTLAWRLGTFLAGERISAGSKVERQ